MRSHRFACIALSAVLLLGGCKSPADKLSDETDKVDSWCASLEMLCQTWLRGSTPTVFAKEMSKTAGDDLKKELKAIQKLELSAGDKESLIRATTRLRDLADSMPESFDRQSKSDVAAKASALEDLGRQLDAMKHASGGS